MIVTKTFAALCITTDFYRCFYRARYGKRLSEVRLIIETELRQAVDLQSKSCDQKGKNVLTDNVEHVTTSAGSNCQLGQVSSHCLFADAACSSRFS
jgi:hypothetical protein